MPAVSLFQLYAAQATVDSNGAERMIVNEDSERFAIMARLEEYPEVQENMDDPV